MAARQKSSPSQATLKRVAAPSVPAGPPHDLPLCGRAQPAVLLSRQRPKASPLWGSGRPLAV
jgi:hypothetical protein